MDATVCHGKPVIAGTRVLVATILGALAGGDSVAEVAEGLRTCSFPDLRCTRVKNLSKCRREPRMDTDKHG